MTTALATPALDVTCAEPATWLPVVGYEGYYEVSDCGQVRSLDRIVRHHSGGPKRLVGKLLSQSVSNATGHLRVPLYRQGVHRRCYVHRLALEAFVGPCPDGLVACHNDGNAANNRIENLRWDTQASNCLDTVRHGANRQSLRTHCPQGHEYTTENTRLERGGRARRCRICRAAAESRRLARKRATS